MIKRSLIFGLPLIGATALLSSCGLPQSTQAHRAQSEMIGMTSYDLQACAGIPTTTKTLNPTTEIWQFNTSYTPAALPSSGIIPIGGMMSLWQAIFGGTGNSCSMIVRLDHDRVSDIHYAGNNDEYFGRDGICSMIVRGCERQPEHTMHTGNTGQKFSPYSSPRTPTQNEDASYSGVSKKYTPVFDKDKSKPLIRETNEGAVPYIIVKKPKHEHHHHKHHHKHDDASDND